MDKRCQRSVGCVWCHQSITLSCRYIVGKFTKPDELLLGQFEGTLPTSKVHIFLDKHRRFVVFDKEVGCLQMSMSSLVNVYGSQHLNEKSALTSDVHSEDPERVYLAAVKNGR